MESETNYKDGDTIYFVSDPTCKNCDNKATQDIPCLNCVKRLNEEIKRIRNLSK